MKTLFNSISRSEWRFVGVLVLVMIVLTGLPYLYAWLTAPANTVYDGLHALSPGDVPVYYSYINQVKQGQFFLKDLFTSEPQDLGTFNVWWAGVGLLAKFFNLSVIVAFQLARILLIPVFMVVAYLFISYFFIKVNQRKSALIFLLFSGGLGFYVAGALDQVDFSGAVSYWWPIDLWLTEAITFNALYHSAHFIASLILMMSVFLFMLLGFEQRKFRYVLISGSLTFFYLNFHPYYLPVILGVSGLCLLLLIIQARRILWWAAGYWLTLILFSLPATFYHFWLIINSPVIYQRAVQNVTLISPFIFVAIGYGFLIPGLFLGLYFLIKKKRLDNRFRFLLIWLVVDLVLIYSPFPFHSRYTQGLHLILAFFTVAGLFGLKDYLQAKWSARKFDFWVNNPALLTLLFIMMFAPSNLYSLARDFYNYTYKTGETPIILYLPDDLMTAFSWLEQQPSGRVILAADVPSKFIPGFSGQTVYLAHAHETLFYFSKLEYLKWFYGAEGSDENKKRFLKKAGIDYVFYTNYEKQLGNYKPSTQDYLTLVFTSPQAEIYQVKAD